MKPYQEIEILQTLIKERGSAEVQDIEVEVTNSMSEVLASGKLINIEVSDKGVITLIA